MTQILMAATFTTYIAAALLGGHPALTLLSLLLATGATVSAVRDVKRD